MTILERITKHTVISKTKTNVVRGLALIALAGAIFTAAAPQAEAQRFAFGVRVGGPVFVPPVRVYRGPVYGGPVYAAPYGYYGYRHDDWRFRHDDWRFRHDHGWR